MKKSFILGAAVLAVALGAGAMISFRQREQAVAAAGERVRTDVELIAGVREKLEEIDEIRIELADQTRVTLEKKDGRWTVAESDGFWADDAKIRGILQGFGKFEVLEQKTANPDLHGKLGLLAPNGDTIQSGTSVVVAAGGSDLASLIVGNTLNAYGGLQEIYVRKPQENQTWLVRSPMDVRGTMQTYVDTDVVNVASARVREVSIGRWDGDYARTLRRTPDASWELISLPEGAEVRSRGDLNTISNQWQNVTHNAVRRTTGFFDGLSSPSLVTMQTYDGLVLTADVRVKSEPPEEYWMTIEAKYDPQLRADVVAAMRELEEYTPPDANAPAEEPGDPAPAAQGEGAPTPTPTPIDPALSLKAAEEVEAEVAEINAHVAGFAFQLPNWKARGILKPNAELYRFPDPPAAPPVVEVTPTAEDSGTTPSLESAPIDLENLRLTPGPAVGE